MTIGSHVSSSLIGNVRKEPSLIELNGSLICSTGGIATAALSANNEQAASKPAQLLSRFGLTQNFYTMQNTGLSCIHRKPVFNQNSYNYFQLQDTTKFFRELC